MLCSAFGYCLHLQTSIHKVCSYTIYAKRRAFPSLILAEQEGLCNNWFLFLKSELEEISLIGFYPKRRLGQVKVKLCVMGVLQGFAVKDLDV